MRIYTFLRNACAIPKTHIKTNRFHTGKKEIPPLNQQGSGHRKIFILNIQNFIHPASMTVAFSNDCRQRKRPPYGSSFHDATLRKNDRFTIFDGLKVHNPQMAKTKKNRLLRTPPFPVFIIQKHRFILEKYSCREQSIHRQIIKKWTKKG